MVSLVPKWISFDAERSILCTQLILAESFRSVSLQDSQRVELAKLLGAGLASIHSVNSNELADLPTATRHRVPTILQLAKYGVGDDPAKIWQTLSAYPDFVKLISEQIQHWTPTGLTHGDMRWDNLLVTKTDDSLKLSIVDWELAGVGDCAWDVGGVLQSYLIDWSVDLIDSDQLQQLTIAFWQAYVVEARLSATGANRLLERTIMFAACRLIQSTFEHHQFGNELESTGRRLLQLSWNILKEPQEVLRSLLPLQAVEL